MYNQPDEEFDRLCREAAENPEGHPSVDGWDKLRRKLDREMPEKPDRRPGWLLWLPFLISIPVAMFYWSQYPASGKNISASLSILQPMQQQEKKLDNNGESISSTNTRNQSSKEETEFPERTVDASAATASTQTALQNRAGDQDKTDTNQPSAKDDLPENEKPGQNPDLLIPALAVKPTRKSPGKPSANDLLQPESARRGKSGKGVQQENEGRLAPLVAGSSTVQDFPQKSGDESGLKQSPPPEPSKKINEQTSPTPLPVQISPKDTSDQDLASKTLSPQENKPSADSAGNERTQEPAPGPIVNDQGFGFMAVFGPDYSNVHFAAGSKSGFSFGMLFEYHFNKRVSLQTGMIYEKKKYTAMGDAYGKIPGYDVNNPNFKMNKVDANCFMWEIPINIRYNLLAGKQHRVFAAGGFSTYLMRKEDLHYYYSYNNVNKYKNWMNDQSSAYWFAVANLSVGYEYRINQLFSVQAEPYFKIPVKGMGYGTVPINSMGILFGIRYRPLNGIDQQKNK